MEVLVCFALKEGENAVTWLMERTLYRRNMGALWGRGRWGCSSAVSSVKKDRGLAGRLLLSVSVSPVGQRRRVFVQRWDTGM